ncbi:MAG: TP0733 family outer membrane beta-barrel protein [Alkalispirochaetaceae bacterium]
MYRTRIGSLILVFFLLLAPVVMGQEDSPPDAEPPAGEPDRFVPTYALGDQLLAINLGMFIPLFFYGGPSGLEDTQLTLGGTGSIHWSSFLNNNMAVGIEGGGMFALTPNRRTLFMLPLMARYTYFLRAFPWEFPIHIAGGVNFSRLEENFKVDPIVKPGFSVLWNYNAEWAFGANFSYWWVPQIYRGPDPPSDQSRYGNFMDVTLSAVYHF